MVEEPVTVILSRKGWIRARTGHGLDVAQLSFKDGDALLQTLECKTTDPVTVLAASGKSFTRRGRRHPLGPRRRRAGQHAGQLRLATTSSGWARATRSSAC